MDTTEKARETGRISTWFANAARLAIRFSLTVAVIIGAAFAVQIGSGELTRLAEAAPSRSCGINAASSSRFSKWQILTTAISANVRVCVLMLRYQD